MDKISFTKCKGNNHPYSEYYKSFDIISEIIEDHEISVFMKLNDEIVGFSLLRDHKIVSIEILKKYTNKDYGTKLLEHVELFLFKVCKKIVIYQPLSEDFFIKKGYNYNNDELVKFRC